MDVTIYCSRVCLVSVYRHVYKPASIHVKLQLLNSYYFTVFLADFMLAVVGCDCCFSGFIGL